MALDPFAKRTRALALCVSAAVGVLGVSAADAAASDYRFELIGKPRMSGGKDVVEVRLVHNSNGKPVPDAVIFQMRADMGPAGMPTMTAPIKALTPPSPGTYRFEVEPAMTGTWALTLAAKVQSEADTVHGSVNVDLAK